MGEQAMSWGNSPADGVGGANSYESREWLIAQAEAERAARLAGHKSLFRRVLERLRPHREQPGGDSHSSYGTGDRDPSGPAEADSPT
jgi:hypothetical protein